MDDKRRFEQDKEWKSTALELGVIGGIGVGVGATLMRGHASGALDGGGKAVKRISKNVDRYLDRAVFKKNPLGRFVYKTLKKVPGQSSRLKKELEVTANPLDFDLNAINARVKADREQAVLKELADAHIQGREARPYKDLFNKKVSEADYFAQGGEAWRNGKDSPLLKGNGGQQGQPKRGDKPKADRKGNLMDEGIGAAVTGLGFGAGLTAFHALDKRLLGEDKKKDRSYEAAGSLMGGNDMDKRAGTASDVYQGVGSFGKKIPNAVANGIGFTGVTLGTASLLEKVRADARKKAGNDQPQVLVIEQESDGKKKRKKNDTLQSVHVLSASHPGNFMMTQHASEGGGLLEKVAANPVQGLLGKVKANPFVQDLAGHGAERKRLTDRLKDHNYEVEALSQFGDQELEAAAQPYLRVHEAPKAKEKGLIDLANQLKAKDQEQHDKLYEQMAKARLTTGGAAVGGFGLASLATRNDKEERR